MSGKRSTRLREGSAASVFPSLSLDVPSGHIPGITCPLYFLFTVNDALFILLNPSILRSPFIFAQYTVPHFLLVVHFPRFHIARAHRVAPDCISISAPRFRLRPWRVINRIFPPCGVYTFPDLSPLVKNYKSDKKKTRSWKRIGVKRRFI